MPAAAKVVGPEVQPVPVVRRALEVGDQAAIGRHLGTAQAVAREIGRLEQALDRQLRGRGGGCKEQARLRLEYAA